MQISLIGSFTLRVRFHADFAIVAKTQYSARILGAVFIRGAINKRIRM